MATYEIELTPAARRSLKSLPRSVVKRVDAKILALGQNPRPQGAKKLRDQDNLLRVRVGDYRILYRVEDDRLLVLVVRISHRREIYR